MRRARVLFAVTMVLTAGWWTGGLAALAAPAAAQPAIPAAASGAAPSVDAFARLPFIEQAELSPDGLYMAGFFGVAGERRICAMSLFGTAKSHCVRIPDGTEPTSLRWVNNDNIIIGLQALRDVGGPFVDGPDRMYIPG